MKLKLLTKTSLVYLLFAVPVMIVSSVVCYNLIHDEVIANTDERIENDFERAEILLKSDSVIEHASLNGEVLIRLSQMKYAKTEMKFSDTVMYDSYEDEMLPFRVLKVKFHGKHDYDVIIRRVYLESEDLTDGILKAMEILFGCLILGFFLINFIVSKTLWTPFRKTLDTLNKYDLTKANEIKFSSSSTQEFSKLNEALNKMTEKIYKDYQNQKQFAENASHEMQTPLAVIKNKIELLIQSKTISEEDMKAIQGVYSAANKLSQLNKTLLLLAKIENRQFTEVKEVSVKEAVEKSLSNFEDMIAFRQITLEKNLQQDVMVKMNGVLSDVLINNLIQNAIRHNMEGGKIKVELADNSLTVSNSGAPLKLKPEEMFLRFRKNEDSADSIGLGLAIAKQICDLYGIKISYMYEINYHIFTLRLRSG